ncbi:hypothetical protein G4B88_009774 [Cannabis sativa]|uniref:DUF4220 domain-containing protein n=2 Tax=Cannabis sativa TaxID=3483 RepID=A0A7J6E4D2_CANSA|nr:hypothetical protein G4B88_009774 [Cannabis sativa]
MRMGSTLDKVQKLWDVWNLRGSIMVSLLIQFLLITLGRFRQTCKSSILHTIIWTAYLLADWVAAFAIGLITQSQGEKESCGGVNPNKQEIHAFWASFLLVHLGGPDTITSFALEDNEFWLRHIFGLIVQFVAATYSLYKAFPTNSLCLPTILVLFVGIIKYSERIRALYLASLSNFGRTSLPKPDPGLDYEEASLFHSSSVKLSVQGEVTAATTITTKENRSYPELVRIQFSPELSDEMKQLKAARFLFERFKGLIVGFFLTPQDQESSKNYFLMLDRKWASRVIEYELSFMFKVLHTKVLVLHDKVGLVFRCIGFLFLFGAATTFVFFTDNHKFGSLEITLTCVLLGGAIALEFVSFIMLLCSDWTHDLLKESWTKYVPSILLKRKRWSRVVFQYDMINYCLKDCPLVYNVFEKFNAGQIIEGIQVMRYSSSLSVTNDLQDFIFLNLKIKSKEAMSFREAMEISQQRGDSALLKTDTNDSYVKLKWSIGEFQYIESLLLWHIATEICYPNKDKKKDKCKILSDYMFYLLITQPKMLSPVLGNWHVVFQDTCAEAKRFFNKHSTSNHDEALNKMKTTKAKVRPAAVRGMKTKSVFFDACILAQQLLNFDQQDRLKIMNLVWLEFMFYAAINCTPIVHAQQPSMGGELLTFTWLLMNHFGLGTQFSEQEEKLETKMVAVK